MRRLVYILTKPGRGGPGKAINKDLAKADSGDPIVYGGNSLSENKK